MLVLCAPRGPEQNSSDLDWAMVIIQDLIGAVISVDVGSAEMATPISIYGQKSTFFGKGVESYSFHQNIRNFDTSNFFHH